MRSPKISRATLASVISAVWLAGCLEAQPPAIPPVETMQADLTVLALAPPEAQHLDETAPSQHDNFATAWQYFSWMTQFMVSVVAIPAGTLRQSAGVEPQRAGEEWVWSLPVLGVDAELRASGPEQNEVALSLYVTSPALGINRFRWVQGSYTPDVSVGFWLLRDQDFTGGNNEVLRIDWQYQTPLERTLTLTNLKAGHERQGDVLMFTQSFTSVTVSYTDIDDPNMNAQIAWDTETGEGSLQAYGLNGGQAMCWGSEFLNRACPFTP